MFLIWMCVWSLVGLMLGTQINRLVYDWSYFRSASPSPYSLSRRPYRPKSIDWIPIIGWFRIRNESEHFGGLFWLRPMLLEIAAGVCVPVMFWYYMTGGLLGGNSFAGFPFGGNPRIGLLPGSETTLWVCFFLHLALFSLMTIATLIDWDEQLIPDQITIPGLFLSVITLTLWPSANLPTLQYNTILVSAINPLQAFSPDNYPAWTEESWTLALVIGCWLVWAILVSYWIFDLRYGLGNGFRYAIASYLRPARKSGVGNRKIPLLNIIVAALFLLTSIAACLIYFAFPTYWAGFLSVTLSMTLAGLGAFGVRKFAGWALGIEGFGFGDVTLMFMLGAAFGWQTALITFLLACILGLFFAVASMIFQGDTKLAFGPWLCIGGAFVVIFWQSVWTGWAEKGLFFLGPEFVIGVCGVCLIALYVILITWQWIKSLLGFPTYG